jgi:hypothetical protein
MIQLPVIEGRIERRVLLNYRIDPDYLRRFLPPPFAPRLYRDHGIGGVCMIRFHALRPRRWPSLLGVDSENAAHRIAVQWTHRGATRHGVFIPRRDTDSRFNHWAGGKVFPGVFQRSVFDVREAPGSYRISIASTEQLPHVAFDGEDTTEFPDSSSFSSLAEASEFFAKGAVGYSLSKDESHFQGMELRFLEWAIRPLKIRQAHVRLFEDGETFPRGSVQVDSALIMQRLRHEWHRIPILARG